MIDYDSYFSRMLKNYSWNLNQAEITDYNMNKWENIVPIKNSAANNFIAYLANEKLSEINPETLTPYKFVMEKPTKTENINKDEWLELMP